jgi:dTDP-4-amino-4,6-dideoxygalactose transaminase
MEKRPHPPAPIRVPFCRPDFGLEERRFFEDAIAGGRLEGGGEQTLACEAVLQEQTGAKRALITPSCTAALEMMALALDLGPGDEVIMPSFTFVSTANAFALRGAIPVFADIDPLTMNLDPEAARAAITPNTKAIMVVHYAGVGCDMEAFDALCKAHGLHLLEDAAQAVGASWNQKPLGSFGTMAAFSFHHTKNVTCGEGGALLVNDPAQVKQCEFIRDKGTDRADFLRGQVSKYEWRVLGSSYLLSELAAGVLLGQLRREKKLTEARMKIWHGYDARFGRLNALRTPQIPTAASHNAHIYGIRFADMATRDACNSFMRERGIITAPHYVPLHLTPAGQKFGRASGKLPHTIDAAQTLLRLPLYSAMSQDEFTLVVDGLSAFLQQNGLDGS